MIYRLAPMQLYLAGRQVIYKRREFQELMLAWTHCNQRNLNK